MEADEEARAKEDIKKEDAEDNEEMKKEEIKEDDAEDDELVRDKEVFRGGSSNIPHRLGLASIAERPGLLYSLLFSAIS